ncbi:MAG TPA: hypothetical protein VIU41_00495 [Geobacteraceae bacterium]
MWKALLETIHGLFVFQFFSTEVDFPRAGFSPTAGLRRGDDATAGAGNLFSTSSTGPTKITIRDAYKHTVESYIYFQ